MTIQPSQLDIARGEGDRTLVLTGVVDSHTASRLSDRLDRLGERADVAIDISGVEFIDSSGLRAVIAAHVALAEAGHRLVLTGSSDPFDRLLEITGLDDQLHRG
ncbi:MAG: STAS domain-containing protein [Acidimicrobiales bacterium]